MSKLEEKRNKIIELIKCKRSEDQVQLLLLVQDGRLDKIIHKLDEKNTKTDDSAPVECLLAEEQFVNVLYLITYYICNDFWFMRYKNMLMDVVLSSKEVEQLLLCEKDVEKYENIPFLIKNIKKACIFNFYKALKKVQNYSTAKQFLKNHKMDINKMNLNNEKDIEMLYQLLRVICFANPNEYSLIHFIYGKSLDKHFDSQPEFFLVQFDILLKEAEKKEPVMENFLHH